MSAPFVHIHNHTEYSLLDGANRIPELVKRAMECDMPALAITDHGVMFGVMEFYFECKKQGIKPLIGMEAYVAPNGLHQKTGREENQTYHLLLLAKDEQGYRNLCKLHSVAALQGFYYKPRIDHDLLARHSKGLVGTSACLGSEICQALLAGNEAEAERIAGLYKEIFDEGSFFIELQDHRIPEQAAIKDSLIRIAKDLRLPLVATNDAHYLCKGDAQAHDVLLCIGTGALVADEKRMRFPGDEFYLKSPEEMGALFADTPEALENTSRVADMCNLELGKQSALMPAPHLEPGETPNTALKRLAREGLNSRLSQVDEKALARLDYEISVIEKTGFESYFLLVREFTQFSRQQGIAFGARGSAAGSLVSYCLGITDVDPLEYDLTFERFLNPERISMPDIDLDFEDERRDEVIKWVTERFGEDHVAQIVTFGTLGAKAAIKDAGRVLGYAPQETDRICKTIPTMPGMTIQKALNGIGEFRAMVENDKKVSELVEVAKTVEGLARHAGVHAAGVVISNDPLMEHIPLYRGNEGQPVTAFEMGILEKIGLLKIDVLGLSNLTVLSRAVENIRKNEDGQHFDLTKIPLDDVKTFEMLSRGETVGVFQLESGGMRRNIIELKPQSVRELAAMVALYRPGPMEHIPRFVDNKFGRKEPEYLDERMREVLEETYGVIVYQDQVLKLVQALAGFSLGKADVLRRAMGKKDKAAMDSMHAEFLAGTHERNIDRKVADKVWELLLPFAGYAFNKAHAVCYAILAYQTAYLKANYTVEYMAALLAVYRSKEDRVTAFIEECRRQKIAVLPPDVNRSGVDFEIEGGASIRFGLAAIKGVGDGLVAGLIAEREKHGPFVHLFEFCDRTKAHGMNRTALDALIRAGALEPIDSNRNKLLSTIDGAMAFADSAARNRLAGQNSLFGGGTTSTESHVHYPVLPEVERPTKSQTLAMEKEVLGIYVSDHPLRGYERTLEAVSTHACSSIEEVEEGTQVRIAGVIANLRTIVTKSKGEKMATLAIEDFSGQAFCTAFPAIYEKYRSQFVKDTVVKLKGIVMHRERLARGGEKTIEIRIEEIEAIEPVNVPELATDETDVGTMIIKVLAATKDQLANVRQVITGNPGLHRVVLKVGGDKATQLELLHRTNPSEELIERIKRTLTRCSIEVENKSTAISRSQETASAVTAS